MKDKETMTLRRGIKANVHRRIAGNRQRLEQARQQDEREQEALRLLNQQTKKEQTKP